MEPASRLHRNFVEHLGAVSAAQTSQAILRSIQAWLRDSLDGFGESVRSRNELDWLSSIDVDAYPMAKSSADLELAIRRMVSIEPRSVDSLAMLVSSVMREAIAQDSGVRCPSCGQDELKVNLDAGLGTFVLACERCSWAQDVEGLPVTGKRALALADSEQYAEYVQSMRGRNGAR